MTGNSFVDTNIFIYARDKADIRKQKIAESLLRGLWDTKCGKISTQVLNEYYVNVTQKLKPGLNRDQAWEDVTNLKEWDPIPLTMSVLEKGFYIQTTYKLSWWDSLIISAASHANCERIYSEDLSHSQLYLGIEVINPFKKATG